jgi:hypothetical protein
MVNTSSKRSLSGGAAAETDGPLVVRPRKAWKLLDCGNTFGYQLMADGEIESFTVGRSRWITVESIHAYIARKLAATAEAAPGQREPRRARLSKNAASSAVRTA